MESLAKQKVSYPEWHARMREDMIIQAMRWNVVDKNATASPAAMREEFNAHPEKYSTPPKVTVSVILLKPEDAAKRDEVSAAIATNSFADVARRYSADSHAAEGGVWKDVTPADVFKKEICDEIAKMPKGTISHWIELDGWSFLLRKDEETPGRARTFAEAYVDVEENVRQAVLQKMYRDWIERLRAETYIKVY
jgi:parvulin-like peptidyl-prolyl isomerase